MGRKESPMDTLRRYKAPILIVAVPVLLVACILLALPRGASRTSFIRRLAPDTFSKRAEQMKDSIPAGQGHDVFCVVFDAGSTGSRVHVYKFTQAGAKLDLQGDTFEQLKPGLSSFADDPQAAADSLQPLLQTALATVPEDLQGRTKVKLGATAGLRLLPGGKAELILDRVRDFLRASPFLLDEDAGVTILDGADEGAFAWLTLNYLLGNLGKGEARTMAAIDLGGGSVQQAYALTAFEAAAAPDGYITKLAGGGRTYSVYVHSYLGFGLMAGRAAVLAFEETRAANPCIPADHSGSYEYAGAVHELTSHPDGASFAACSKLVAMVLKLDADCGAPRDQCAFNGAWGGGRKPTAFYVSSYFWDRATDAGIIADEGAITWTLKPDDLGAAAQKACAASAAKVADLFPKVEKAQAPYLCLDLSFQHALLTHGFKIEAASPVTLVKRVKYLGQEIEAAWPLGAAINLLSS